MFIIFFLFLFIHIVFFCYEKYFMIKDKLLICVFYYSIYGEKVCEVFVNCILSILTYFPLFQCNPPFKLSTSFEWILFWSLKNYFFFSKNRKTNFKVLFIVGFVDDDPFSGDDGLLLHWLLLTIQDNAATPFPPWMSLLCFSLGRSPCQFHLFYTSSKVFHRVIFCLPCFLLPG